MIGQISYMAIVVDIISGRDASIHMCCGTIVLPTWITFVYPVYNLCSYILVYTGVYLCILV